MVEPHVAPQLHQCAVGLLPCPAAGALSGFGQRVAVLFHTDNDGFSLVGLRLGVHHGEDALRACRCRQQRVHLLADLADGLAHLLHIQQVRAQRAHVEHAADGQQSAYAAGDGVVDLAEVAHGRHHHTGVGLRRRGGLTVRVVESGELTDGLLLVVKDLDDLLTLDHLLDIAVHRAQRRLLPLEIHAAAAADDLHHAAHQRQKAEGDQRQPRVQDDHHQHRAHKGQHIGDDAGEAAVQHLRHGVDIVGKAAHQVAGLVLVIVADGQLLQAVEQILPDGGHCPLGHMHHNAGVGVGAPGAEGEQPAQHHQHFQQAGEVAGEDIVVQKGLQQIAGGHAGGGADDQAHGHQHQRRLVFPHVAHQLLEGALHILGPLVAVGIGAVAAPGRSRFVVSHRCSPLPAGIHRPRGKYRSAPSAARGCPVPRCGRRPAQGSYPRPSRR